MCLPSITPMDSVGIYDIVLPYYSSPEYLEMRYSTIQAVVWTSMAGKRSLENKQANTMVKTDSLGSPASQNCFSGPEFVTQHFRLNNNLIQ